MIGHRWRCCYLLLAIQLLTFGSPLIAAEPTPLDAKARVVFLGDSITDGETYILWCRQGLAATKLEAGAPRLINAAIAGNTAKQMHDRLERDVFSRRPTHVALHAGANDTHHNVSPEDYQQEVLAIADALAKRKIELIVMTACPVAADKPAAVHERLAAYNKFLRQLAADRKLRLADVDKAFRALGENPDPPLIEKDGVHITLAGYRPFAQSVLAALGHGSVDLPAKFEYPLLPGLVRSWRLRVAPKEPLDEALLAKLDPSGEGWKSLELPGGAEQTHWWQEQERRRGFALDLNKSVGEGQKFQGVAVLESDTAREVVFGTAAQLQTIWLNGRQIVSLDPNVFTGWHAGKERISAQLQPGKNVIVVETGPNFALTLTPADAE